MSAATRNRPAFLMASIRFAPGGNFLAFFQCVRWHLHHVCRYCHVVFHSGFCLLRTWSTEGQLLVGTSIESLAITIG
jgi:hypothetical protein